MAEQTKRQELESYLAARALQDPGFREKLLQAPKQTIENEINLHFPKTLKIKVHEEKLNELHGSRKKSLRTSRSSERTRTLSDCRQLLSEWDRAARRSHSRL